MDMRERGVSLCRLGEWTGGGFCKFPGWQTLPLPATSFGSHHMSSYVPNKLHLKRDGEHDGMGGKGGRRSGELWRLYDQNADGRLVTLG